MFATWLVLRSPGLGTSWTTYATMNIKIGRISPSATTAYAARRTVRHLNFRRDPVFGGSPPADPPPEGVDGGPTGGRLPGGPAGGRLGGTDGPAGGGVPGDPASGRWGGPAGGRFPGTRLSGSGGRAGGRGP